MSVPPPPPQPPGRAGVPSHPPVPLGDPPGPAAAGVAQAGSPVGYGVTCTPPWSPTAGKVLGINNAHCFPLMNITDLPGRQLRAPAGGAGASPASPRPGTPPAPTCRGSPQAAGPCLHPIAACHCPGYRWGPWAEPGEGGARGYQGLRAVRRGGSLPLLTHPPPCPRTGSGLVGRGIHSWWERKSRGPKDARSSPAPRSCRVTPVPVPGPQQHPLPAVGPGLGQGTARV